MDPSRAGPHTSSTGYASNKHSVLPAPRGQDGVPDRRSHSEVPPVRKSNSGLGASQAPRKIHLYTACHVDSSAKNARPGTSRCRTRGLPENARGSSTLSASQLSTIKTGAASTAKGDAGS